MIERIHQVLKRLEDMLRIQSAILEQSEELGWVLKDVLEDLVLVLNDEHSSIRETKEGIGKPTPQRDSAVGVPSVVKEEVSA